MKLLKDLKVAIVHDWLVGGGAERVVYELHQLFPEAPIYTSYCSDEWRQKLDGKVITGWLQHWPFSKLRKFIPILRIWWFSNLDLSGYDLVISSSGNGEAKSIKAPAGTPHICYCHSPTHFYWRHYEQYVAEPGFGAFNPLARLALKILVSPLRKMDYKAAQRPDFYIANSTHTQADIKKYYNREAVVVHPPIDVSRFSQTTPSSRHGFVTAGRQVPYKHTDIIIEACNQLQLPLKVIGRGPDHSRLKQLAGSTIELLDNVPDADMPELLASAEAFLFAAFEDFGITPIEAMATGTPVIAYQAGGALDYVQPGQSGMFFIDQSVASLKDALRTFDGVGFHQETVKTHAQQFSVSVFHANFLAALESALSEGTSSATES